MGSASSNDGGGGTTGESDAASGSDAADSRNDDDAGAAKSFAPLSSTALAFTLPANTSSNPNPDPITIVNLVFSSKSNVAFCPSPQTTQEAEQLGIQFGVRGEAVTVGSYTLTTGKIAAGRCTASFRKLDATCDMVSEEDATAGTVTITAVSATELTGTLDFTFPSGSVERPFTVTLCVKTPAELKGVKASCLP